MKASISKLPAFLLATVFLAALGVMPAADARPGGGGGHGGGGGRAGGGGGRPAGGGARPPINNNHADVRTNNVRNTSVNNVNVNRNVVVAGNNRGYGHGGWDNDYHPVATAAAVTATVAVTSAVVGSMVRTVPTGCVPVNYAGYIYQQCGTVWYQSSGSQYVVVNPPY